MSQSDIAISVRNISKAYTISHEAIGLQGRRPGFRETVTNFLSDPFQRTPKETFWAVKDVSFDVNKGDVVGIIGRNGAGKSTLLKILSRITKPTSGEIDVYGRIGSLLEVGTGFHPELTGRENIFLNGAILGMTRAEIRKQFQAIVDFAGVEQFLDTPVKRFSSGMYVRLAFAVAAHLRNEILIIDEVLAVGDAEFQNKCMGKMKDVAGEGRTVLFVSHNVAAIQRLCKRAILLQKGSVARDGSAVDDVIGYYTHGNLQVESADSVWHNSNDLFAGRTFQPTRFLLTDESGTPLRAAMRNDSPAWVIIEGNICVSDSALNVGYALYSADGQLLYWSCIWDAVTDPRRLDPGTIKCRSRLPQRLLNEGTYRVELIAGLHNSEWICEPGLSAPSIAFRTNGGLSDSSLWMSKRPGILAPILNWELETN